MPGPAMPRQYAEAVPEATSTDAGDVPDDVAGDTVIAAPVAGNTVFAAPVAMTVGSAPRRWSTGPTVITAILVAGCVAAAIAAIVPARNAVLGIPDAGAFTELALPAVKSLFDLSAAVTVGWLLAAAVLVPPQRSGIFDVGGYRAMRAVGPAALVWMASGIALIPLTLSDAVGKPVSSVVGADTVITGLQVLESARAPLMAAIAAALIGVISRAVLRPSGAALLLLGALAALVPQAAAGHASQLGDHDLGSDTMIVHLVGISVWVGGLVAFLGLARQRVDHLNVVAHRYSQTALVAYIAVALSGLGNAWVRFASFSDLWLTAYGRLVLVKAGLLVLLGLFGYVQRRKTLPLLESGSRWPLIRLATVEILVMAATFGVAAALSRTASPPPSGAAPDPITLVLGFPLSGEPTFWRLLTDWRFDLIFGTASILAVVLYLAAVRRLSRRGVRWPPGRTWAWCLGWLMVLLATSSGLGRYAEAQFSIHMIAHMTIGMVAPILLVLGGPVTLALRVLKPAGRAGVPGLREAILRAVHSPITKFLTHPLIVLALFIFSFYAVYFTSLFEPLATTHVGHLVMNAHFLLVGYLYYWVIIGIDPAPRRLPPLVKLGLLLAALPFHAFFGLALMNSHTALGADFYGQLGLPWVTSLITDERTGGAIAWGATELPIIIVVIALMSQWARSDEREGRRSDRQGNARSDDELDSYNAMLAELAFRDLDAGQRSVRQGGGADGPAPPDR